MADKNMKAKINVEFEEAASRQQINSGEDVSTLFGKIRKFLADLKAVAFSGAYSDLSGVPDLTRYATKTELDTKAEKALYGDTTISVGRLSGSTVGERSTAEGGGTTASGNCSHAEGAGTVASGDHSHAEGANTKATQAFTHAEGNSTTCNAPYAHAEGYSTIAAGPAAHAEGQGTQAVGNNSHSGGYFSISYNNSSFSHGIYTIANKDCEIAFGKYNGSNDDTLFSIGDGTADDARHNAFEITKTGGKLHDKDIATTDLIPTSLPANGGNADTVDGKHASDFKAYQRYAPIYIGDLLDMTEMGTYSCSQDNCTNLPSEIYSWCYITMTSFRDVGYRQFVCSPFNSISSNKHSLYLANEAFKDSNGNLIWDKFYSDRYKPYVTGSATVEANSNVCVSNHGFTPSAVIWWDGSLSGVAVSFSDTKFTIDKTNSVDRTINYLMFK